MVALDRLNALRDWLQRAVFWALLLGCAPGAGAANPHAVILQYHHVSADTPAATSVTPDQFAMHLEQLAAAGFEVLPLPQVVNALQAREPLPDKTAVITFDDGYKNVYENAWPLLKARGWPFTVFVNTAAIDDNVGTHMNWSHLKELTAAGVTIANHGHRHEHWLRLKPDENPMDRRVRLIEEVKTAEQRLRDELGQAPRLLAYPYGEFSPMVMDLVQGMGYVGFGQQSGPVGADSDFRALPRFAFNRHYGTEPAAFREKILTLPLPHLQQRLTDADGEPLEDWILNHGVERPRWQITLEEAALAKQVSCYASGQGKISVQVDGAKVTAQAEQPVPVGRSRYNCTAPSGESGRWYWLSLQWIRKADNNTWYAE